MSSASGCARQFLPWAMYFRSVRDLNACVISNLHRIPREVEVIAGIPRSGLLPATLLSLYLNRPLTDVDGLIQGRLIESGPYRKPASEYEDLTKPRKIMLIDDSISSGKTMKLALARIDSSRVKHVVTTAAVYATPSARKLVDLFFEICPGPRVFEWNVMHHGLMPQFCIELEGILCAEPVEAENQDGPRYEQLLQYAKPRFIPTRPIGYVVTCRLEKYRELTEEWLKRYGVRYQHLVMSDLLNKETRLALENPARFKAEVYKSTKTVLFIESSREQANEIVRLAGKPVLCTETNEMINPALLAESYSRGKDLARKAMDDPLAALIKAPRFLKRQLDSLIWRIATKTKRRNSKD
jgi:uncharacterized HAD superfamily protein/hypoxanthine phosphoribosyltransferase